MHKDAETVPDTDSRTVRRRQALVVLARSFLVSAAMVVAYFVLPMTSPLAVDTVLELTIGLTAVVALLTWQIMGIMHSPYPGLQALAALTVTVPLFLLMFATTYYLMSFAAPGSFTEPLTKLDSVYYAVTTFATVGFGDIAASSPAARATVTLQMVGGLVLVGFIARVVVAVVEEARRRRRAEGPAD